ncbi:MAG TPA: SRPBCC family protein [Acidimicrobiales bacterium]|jgi:carbon monoxide dehydrogenase subunit G|nr:SRPBCC family protein [Acidimicrobiales bacterium]
MSRIRVQTVIDAPRAAVWGRLADITDHVNWMADARSLRFTGDRRSGVGTTFECETRVGPLRTTDAMEVTEWRPRRSLGVRHVGLVTGTGRFVLRRARGGRTRVTWDERLRFPWWLGGPVTGLLAAPVLRRIWRGNLRRLAAITAPPPPAPAEAEQR